VVNTYLPIWLKKHCVVYVGTCQPGQQGWSRATLGYKDIYEVLMYAILGSVPGTWEWKLDSISKGLGDTE
jgi:hypothetical protein